MYVKILNKFEYCIQPNTVFLMFVFLFCFLVMFSKFLLLVVPVLVTGHTLQFVHVQALRTTRTDFSIVIPVPQWKFRHFSCVSF